MQAKIQMIQILVRYLMTVFGLYVICIYVLTDDKEEEGTKMDQIKDFTAFVIIFDLDTIIVGPFLNNFFNPSDLELHLEEDEQKDQVNQKVIDNATQNIKVQFSEGVTFVKVMYIIRTFAFYLSALYLELNFVLYAVIFVTRAEEAAALEL